MKLKKIIRKIVMSAAAALLAAAMTVTSFAANPENLPTGSGGTLPGTINVTPGTVTPGQIYTPTTEKEDRSGTKYQPGKYTNNIPEEERTTIHFKLANDSMASGTMKDYIAAKNSSFQLPECGFKAKEGYVFERYVGFGENSARPEEYISIGDADEYWVWACFRPIEYASVVFSFNSVEAKGQMETVKVEKGSKFKLPECTLIPQYGYDFDYWETPLGNLKPGYSIQLGYNKTNMIWARFKEVSYVNVIFDNGLKGSDNESFTSQVLFEYDKNNNIVITLPKLKFKSVKGVKFNNWKGGKPGEKYILGSADEYIYSTPVVYAEPEKTKVKMSDCSISVKSGDWKIYTGEAITPKYSLINKYGVILEEGVDFKAEYSDNIVPGKGKITVTGINGNTGTRTFHFKILPPKITISASMQYGDLKVRFSRITKDLRQVEIQVSLREKFNYTPEMITEKAELLWQDIYWITIPSSWKNADAIYVRARYVSNGVNGDWSKVIKIGD